MDQSIGLHIITVFSILSFKLSILFVGYFIIKMGYELMVKGVTGEFKFEGSLANGKAGLKSASPGLLFLTLGVALMVTAVMKDKPFSTSTSKEIGPTAPSIVTAEKIEKPSLTEALKVLEPTPSPNVITDKKEKPSLTRALKMLGPTASSNKTTNEK